MADIQMVEMQVAEMQVVETIKIVLLLLNVLTRIFFDANINALILF